jgi:hypothetical protein
MDVIGFLCVSLGSSTAQLHDSLGSRRACTNSEVGFSTQNDDRRAVFSCGVFVAKGIIAMDILKEMFPVYGGKCLSLKAVL